jgi:hypothetical protein
MPTTRQVRRRFLGQHFDLAGARLLEIGAMDSPTLPEFEPPVRYLDWFSRDELIELHGDNERRRPERIVEVDYTVKRVDFSSAVSDRFELAIANHVIEHVPDAIRWLQEIDKLTTDDGALFLSVPDRRYTFDYLRPESTLPDLLRAHDLRLEVADYYQVLSSVLYHRPVRAADAWSGRLREKLGQARFSVPEAMRRAREMSSDYSGVHCHVFTRASFERLFDELAESGLISWRISAVDDVARDSNEFHVLLRKPGTD